VGHDTRREFVENEQPHPGSGGGGGVLPPQPTPLRLPPRNQVEKFAQIEAAIGRPRVLAYGRHLVGGNRLFQQELTAGGDTVVFQGLGHGQWNKILWLDVNGKIFDHTDTARFHFHPGKDAELGVETAPATPNQKICSLWPSPARPQSPYHQLAYLAAKLAPDPGAPTDGFDIIGAYETRLVRTFDNTGTETGFTYTPNPAWCALDAIIETWVKPHASIDEALTTAEKLLFDWPAWKDWADDCDADIGGGVKRWEAHVAFVDKTDLLRGLEWLLLLGRAYLIEVNGKLSPRHDESRTSAATYTTGHFAGGSFLLSRKDFRDRANQLRLKWRDLESGKAPGTISTTGTAVTGVDTDFTRRLSTGKPADLRSGAQAGEVRETSAVASDTSATLKTAFSANQSGVKYGSPFDDFQERSREENDEAHQDEAGRRITAEIQLGNSTGDRAERLGVWQLERTKQEMFASGVLLDDSPSANDHTPGDRVTAPDSQGFGRTRAFELLELERLADLSGVEVRCQEYSEAGFTDSSSGQQPAGIPLPAAPQFTRVIQSSTDESHRVVRVERDADLAEIVRGMVTGQVRDGDVVTFLNAFEKVPTVRLVAANTLVYIAADTATDQKIRFEAIGITRNGFTAKVVIIKKNFTTTLKSVVPAGAAPNQLATKNTIPEAYDDKYIFTFDVTVNPAQFGDPSFIDLEFWERPSAGAWSLRGTRTYSNTDEFAPNIFNNETFPITFDGAGLNHEFKIVEVAQEGPGGSLDNFGKLEWFEASSAVTETSATPDASDYALYRAQEGENA